MIKPRKPPYSDTKADPTTSEVQISKLLEEYGVSGTQWTKDFSKKTVSLRFVVEAEIKGKRMNIAIELIPPLFEARRRTYDQISGRYEKIYAPNWAQSFRLLYWYLKTKLEAIAYGLTTVEKEFLSDIVHKLPDGSTQTLYNSLWHRIMINGDVWY